MFVINERCDRSYHSVDWRTKFIGYSWLWVCVHLDNLNRKIRTICCFDKTVRLCGNESKTNSHTRKLLWWKFQIIVKIHWVSCAFSDCQWKIKTQRWRNMDNVTPCDNKIISRNKINESWQQYKKNEIHSMDTHLQTIT